MGISNLFTKTDRTKIAAAYKYEGKLIVSTYDVVKGGPWIEQTAALVENDEGPALVGFSIHRALAMVRFDVPQPDRSILNSMEYRSLQISGAKSLTKFMKSAQCVGVEQVGVEITITPHKNEGTRGGFVPIRSKTKLLMSPDDRFLGEAILAAFTEVE